MLHANVFVDLPSAETLRKKTVGDRLRSLFGAELDLRSGREALTMTAFSLVSGLVEAFASIGVDDVLSFIVDRKVVYLDTRDVPGDLPLVKDAAEQKGVFERPFGEMHLVLAHKAADLHTLIDVRIESEVVKGDDEMRIALTGRVESLRIRAGESATQYRERVHAFAADAAAFDPYRARLAALADRMAEALGRTLVGARARTDATEVRLIRPDARQMARFAALPFGEDVRAPEYRGAPTSHRAGAYDDPFFVYYYDPYYSLTNYIILDSMLHAHAHPSHVNVVDPSGHAVASVDDGWTGHDAVSFSSAGVEVGDDLRAQVDVDDTRWGTSDVSGGADAGGGFDVGSDGGSDSGSGADSSCGSSSSSCGSSCGGSSCGGGCGGGGD